MDSILLAPALQSPACSLDRTVIETIGHNAVIRKRLQLGGSMASLPFGKDTAEIDCFASSSLTVTNDARDGTLHSLLTQRADLLYEVEELRKRNLTATFRRHDRRDVPLLHPTVERGLADPEQARAIRGPHSRTDKDFEKLSGRHDVFPYRRVSMPSSPSKVHQAFECLLGPRGHASHRTTNLSSNGTILNFITCLVDN